MLSSRMPIQVGYYGRPQILMVAQSSNLLTQLIRGSPGQPALYPFLKRGRSPQTQKKLKWVGSIHRQAGSPSNRILGPTLVLGFSLPRLTAEIPGVAPIYLSQTTFIFVIRKMDGQWVDPLTINYSKQGMLV